MGLSDLGALVPEFVLGASGHCELESRFSVARKLQGFRGWWRGEPLQVNQPLLASALSYDQAYKPCNHGGS